MKLTNIVQIALTRLPATEETEHAVAMPAIIKAAIEVEVTDAASADGIPHRLNFGTRLMFTPGAEGLAAIERLALRNLAQELRALADAFDRAEPPT